MNEWSSALHQLEHCDNYVAPSCHGTPHHTTILTDKYKQDVLDYLRDKPPTPPNTIASATGLSKHQVHRVLRLLVADESVVTVRKKMHKIGDPFVFYTLP